MRFSTFWCRKNSGAGKTSGAGKAGKTRGAGVTQIAKPCIGFSK